MASSKPAPSGPADWALAEFICTHVTCLSTWRRVCSAFMSWWMDHFSRLNKRLLFYLITSTQSVLHISSIAWSVFFRSAMNYGSFSEGRLRGEADSQGREHTRTVGRFGLSCCVLQRTSHQQPENKLRLLGITTTVPPELCRAVRSWFSDVSACLEPSAGQGRQQGTRHNFW